jgi:hypothetical protein
MNSISIGFWGIIAAFFIGAASTSIPLYLSHKTRSEVPQIRPKVSSSLSAHLANATKKITYPELIGKGKGKENS